MFLFDRRCAFVFAHYDDSILDAAQAMMRCGPGSIDLVLCSAVPRRNLSSLKYRPPLLALRRTAAYRTLIARTRGRAIDGGWDLTCGYSDPWTAMDARVAEHEDVCRSLSIATAGLGDLDSQYGESKTATQVAALSAAIGHLRENDIEVVVTHGPWAGHPDHARASRLAMSAARAVGIPVVTVCDRPYTDCSDGCVRNTSVGEHTTTTLDDDEWQTKHEAVEKYAGQLIALTASFGDDWARRSRLAVECLHGDVTRSDARPRTVSVVIPVYNARDVIDVQLDALAKQDYDGRFEVVISDNGSTDGLTEYLSDHRWTDSLSVRVVDASARRGAAFARNVGASHASGEFVAFCDADDEVHPGWLRALTEAAPKFDIVTTAVEGESLNPRKRRWAVLESGEDFQLKTTLPTAVGGSTGCWKTVFEALDGYSEDWEANEDVDFSWRAQMRGYTVGHVPRALVAVRYRTGARDGYRQGVARGMSMARLTKAYPNSGLPEPSFASLGGDVAKILWSNPVFFDVPPEEWGLVVGIIVGLGRGKLRYRA